MSAYVGFTLGTDFCRFPMSIAPSYFKGLTIVGYFCDDEVVRPTPHHPASHSSQAKPSSSSQPPPPDYTNLQDALRSIQEEQVSLRAFVVSENTAIRDFVQERDDKLHGLFASQTQYFQDYRACLET